MLKRALALFALTFTPVLASDATAAVTSTTRSITYSPAGPLDTFTVPFHFNEKDQLSVVAITIATSAEQVLTRGASGNFGYTVTLPIGGSLGFISTNVTWTTTHQIQITRVVPLTQTRRFGNQQNYNPKRIEDALDKVTMALQQVNAAAGTDGQTAVDTHVGNADDHTQYFLLAGRAGGQTGYGDTADSGDLVLGSTAHANKGSIFFGSGTEFDEANNRLGIGKTGPTISLDVVGAGAFSTVLTVPTLQGNTAAGNDLTLDSNTSNDGFIYLGSESAYDESSSPARLGIGTLTPSDELVVASGIARLGESTSVTLEFYNSAQTASVFGTHNTGALNLSAGTNKAGSGFAGFLMFGDTHATNSDEAYVYGDEIFLADTDGNVGVTLNFSGGAAGDQTFEGQIQGRFDYIQDATAGARAVTVPDECGALLVSTDSITWNLPAAGSTTAGCRLQFMTALASKSATVAPDGTDTITGNCAGHIVQDAAANTICETTCGSYTCVSGLDTATNTPVDCNDNTADECTCMFAFSAGAGTSITNAVDGSTSNAYANESVTVVSDGSNNWYVTQCDGAWDN